MEVWIWRKNDKYKLERPCTNEMVYSVGEKRFLRASAILKHVIDIGWTSVCLSVRLSVCHTLANMTTAEYIVMLSSPHDSPFILVLCVSRFSRNSDRVTPCGAAKQRWGVKISQFSTNNLLYLKTAEGRWVHAARRLTSTEFSFDPCNTYRDCPRGVHRRGQNVQKCAKMANF